MPSSGRRKSSLASARMAFCLTFFRHGEIAVPGNQNRRHTGVNGVALIEVFRQPAGVAINKGIDLIMVHGIDLRLLFLCQRIGFIHHLLIASGGRAGGIVGIAVHVLCPLCRRLADLIIFRHYFSFQPGLRDKMSQSSGAWMWKAFLQKQGRTENIPPTPKAPRKSLVNTGVFRGYFPTRYLRLRRIYARFCSRRAAPAQDRGAVPLPPIREESPAAYRARPSFCDTLHGQRPFQHRIKGQHRRAEIAAISARPALAQHIAGTVQRQAAIVFIVVGAPFCHQLTDCRLFLPGQFTAHFSLPSWA